MQLRQACRALQLPTLGNKEALQQRLAGQAIHDDDGGDDDDDADDDDDQEDGGHEGVDGEEGGGGDDVEMDASLAPDTLKWMGECARTIAVVPAHLTYDPLYEKMIDKIIERHKNRFHFDTTSAPGSAGVVTPSVPLELEVRCDSQPTLEFLPKTESRGLPDKRVPLPNLHVLLCRGPADASRRADDLHCRGKLSSVLSHNAQAPFRAGSARTRHSDPGHDK